MNLITDTWRQLVRRKLWPVALLLVGALVAVPVVLAKQPATAPPAPSANAGGAAGESIPATFVSSADAETAEDSAERRRVLGVEKDPFEPAELKKVKASKKKQPATPTTSTKKDEGSKSAGKTETKTGGEAPGKGTTTPPVSPAPTPTPTATVPQFSIKLRFGTTDADLETKTVERLSVLPNDEAPVLVYRGVEDGGKVAIFELTGQVEAQGDGKCEPAPENCQYLKLRAGETEFITVTETGDETDAQYQIDLLKIYKKATKVAATETAQSESLAKASSAGLGSVSLRRRNRYVFDEATGTLHRARGKTS